MNARSARAGFGVPERVEVAAVTGLAGAVPGFVGMVNGVPPFAVVNLAESMMRLRCPSSV